MEDKEILLKILDNTEKILEALKKLQDEDQEDKAFQKELKLRMADGLFRRLLGE